MGKYAMIWAKVLQKREHELTSRERGTYGFLQLPAAGDHIQILNNSGLIDLMKVLYVQHTPLTEGSDINIYREATVHLICAEIATDVPLAPH
jgi:hypothetical protein